MHFMKILSAYTVNSVINPQSAYHKKVVSFLSSAEIFEGVSKPSVDLVKTAPVGAI